MAQHPEPQAPPGTRRTPKPDGFSGAGRRLTLITRSPSETGDLGARLGQLARPGQFIALLGDLGAGKTCLAQGLLRGLGVAHPAGSPTYTLVHTYQADGRTVHHFDLYRLGGAPELRAIGWDDYLGSEAVVVVEWADRARDLWPSESLVVHIAFDAAGDFVRRLVIEASGPRSAALLAALAAGAATATDITPSEGTAAGAASTTDATASATRARPPR